MHAVNGHNPWVRAIQDARGGRARWRWGAWPAVAASCAFTVAVLLFFKQFGGAIEQGLAPSVANLPAPWPDVLVGGALQLMIFGLFLVAAVFAAWLGGQKLFCPAPGGVKSLASGVAIGAGGYWSAVGVAALAGAVIGAPAGTPASPLGPILFGVALIAVQSLSEEMFFRGWLQPVLCADWGAWVGLVVASLLFGALHVIAGAQGLLAIINQLMGGPRFSTDVQAYAAALLAMINLFMGGLLFGLLALRAGNLLAPAAAHFAWNWAESGMAGLSSDPTGSFFNLRFAGSPIWNGGVDTMNGSLATFLVLVLLVLALARMKPRPR